MEKNKKKMKNKALARPHPPGGANARSENVIFLAIGATAPPRPSYGAPARLTHPRDGLDAPVRYQASKRAHTPSWRACTVRASAHWPWRVRALALVALRRKSATSAHGNDNGANSDDEHTKDRIFSRLYTCAQRTVPSLSVGCANAKDNNSGLF
ncbi:hypothetical protein PIB30_096381 [Stylosanthes scabra]|uniref:Uncharacterized protein n=1 Tax=Stylosanthes scabra TaxID=79078 RepID=A0ABU6QVY9_9FABA|nr:hypothetical protein [Stylosanthes scabra]